MKEKLQNFYKTNKKMLIIFFVLSILTYGYFGINTILNVDGINDLKMNDMAQGFRTHISMGRFGWAFIASLFNYSPVPFLLLFINSALLSISAVFANKIFDIKSDIFKFLIGLFVVSFPFGLNAYAYIQWQFIYGITIFSCIFGSFLLKNCKTKKELIFPILLYMFAISCYQSFVNYILTFVIILAILKTIEIENKKELLKEYLKYAIVLILSFILYFILYKLSLFVFSIEPNKYNNADKMFDLSIIKLIQLYQSNSTDYFKMFFNDYLKDIDRFFPYILKLISTLFVIWAILICLIKGKRKILLAVLFIFLVISPEFIHFLKPNSFYHIIARFPFAAFYIAGFGLTLYMVEKYFNYEQVKKIILFLTIPFTFILLTNANKASYLADLSFKLSYSQSTRLLYQIEKINGYEETPKKKLVYFTGYNSFNKYPETKDIFPFSIGLTQSYMYSPRDMVDSLRVLGFNAVNANKYLSLEDKNEIYKLSQKHCFYPCEDSIFKYKDVIVVNMKP